MNISFTFKNTPPNNGLTTYCEKKLAKLIQKFCTKLAIVNVRFEKNKREHSVICNIKSGHSIDIELSSKGVEIFSCIDFLIDKAEKKLKKIKEKFKNKNKNNNKKEQLNELFFDQDWELIPIDAEDIIKYKKTKNKKYG